MMPQSGCEFTYTGVLNCGTTSLLWLNWLNIHQRYSFFVGLINQCLRNIFWAVVQENSSCLAVLLNDL